MDSLKHNSTNTLDNASTIHIRCGSDIQNTLSLAGFQEEFFEFADPFCQGPIKGSTLKELQEQRSRFIADAYHLNLEDTQKRGRQEYEKLNNLNQYKKINLWFEHDSYDQLILIFLLQSIDPQVLIEKAELISTNKVPHMNRFFGLGQLSPEQLKWVWENKRTRITHKHITFAQEAWLALTSDSPLNLNKVSQNQNPPLPYLPHAIQRHLQELPSTTNGLSLTQQLVLEILAEYKSITAGKLFHLYMHEKEPLPYLGDLMFWHVLEDMQNVSQALFEASTMKKEIPWNERTLTITKEGHHILKAEKNFLDIYMGIRWVGGIKIEKNKPCWKWDKATKTVIHT